MQKETHLQLIIRPYIHSDYESVITIYKEGDLYEEEMDGEKVIKKKIERDPESILVAVNNKEIVGTVSIIEDGRFAFIFRLAVKASERKKGIGTKLILKAEEMLKQRGNTYVNIIVNEKEISLQRYYEKRNYKKGRVWRWMWKELQ